MNTTYTHSLALRACIAAWLVLLSGCAPDEIETLYGRRRGANGASVSVNGTAVLADMIRESGARVSTWRRLSPKLETADAIVWLPDDFQPPTPAQQLFLENWLQQGNQRTLVYVGRDYDSAIQYWRALRPLAPPEQTMEVARRLAMAQSEHDAARAAMPAKNDTPWFVMRGKAERFDARELSGTWSDGIDSTKVEIEIAGRLVPPAEAEGRRVKNLLSADGEPFVFQLQEESWGTSKVLVVNNGSFLLNLPLVNREHRKLAGRLITACAPARRIILLESEEGGPPIVERDAESNFPTGLEIFTVWPLGFVMLHLAIAGITLCIACFPIFGRPKEISQASTSDFGQHITALGDLLSQTQDRQFAIDRLKYYYEHVRGDN